MDAIFAAYSGPDGSKGRPIRTWTNQDPIEFRVRAFVRVKKAGWNLGIGSIRRNPPRTLGNMPWGKLFEDHMMKIVLRVKKIRIRPTR